MGLPDRQELRVGDTERQVVVDQLRVHLSDGRLTLDEFEERTGSALAARTVAELQIVTADLPTVRTGFKGPPIRQRPPRPPADGWDIAWSIHVGVWLLVSVFLVVIWLLTGAGYFWPIWPFLGIGLTVGVHGAVRKAVRG